MNVSFFSLVLSSANGGGGGGSLGLTGLTILSLKDWLILLRPNWLFACLDWVLNMSWAEGLCWICLSLVVSWKMANFGRFSVGLTLTWLGSAKKAKTLESIYDMDNKEIESSNMTIHPLKVCALGLLIMRVRSPKGQVENLHAKNLSNLSPYKHPKRCACCVCVAFDAQEEGKMFRALMES